MPSVSFKRYAIFYTPPQGPFAAFGAGVLGWDSRKGCVVENPMPSTERPRKYGFHATLKAPFRPADGITQAEIGRHVARWAAGRPAVTVGALSLQHKFGYLALRPVDAPLALNRFAADVVRDLDPLRAPLSAGELARRNHAGLTDRQQLQTRDWGYPYVFDDFEFHMTLTGRIKKSQAPVIRNQLDPLLEKVVPAILVIEEVTLMAEKEDGFFIELERFRLRS